jgi:RNA polymerase sigma-70 factor (ECF subfamily)
VQEVFIKAYQNIESFDATRSFSPWIYRIAHNTFVNELRKQHREPVSYIDFDALVAHPSYEIDPAGDEEKRQMKELLQRGLATLTSSQREVLVLYYSEDLSYQAIADVLRVPVGTVGVRLKRAREALGRTIENGPLKKHIDGN